MKSEKGQQLIDDYYYSGNIMKGEITFSMAWKFYRLFGINLFKRFPQFFLETYTNNEREVLVNKETFDIITELCAEAKNISDDARFQSIITRVKSDVDLYYND